MVAKRHGPGGIQADRTGTFPTTGTTPCSLGLASIRPATGFSQDEGEGPGPYCILVTSTRSFQTTGACVCFTSAHFSEKAFASAGNAL
jgi:hypothetical protein